MRWPLNLRKCTRLSSVREDCSSFESKQSPNASTGQRKNEKSQQAMRQCLTLRRCAHSSSARQDCYSFESKPSPNSSTNQKTNTTGQRAVCSGNGTRTTSSHCSSIDAPPNEVDVNRYSNGDDDDMSMLSFSSKTECNLKAVNPPSLRKHYGRQGSAISGLYPGSVISGFSTQNGDGMSMNSTQTYGYSLNGVGSPAKYNY